MALHAQHVMCIDEHLERAVEIALELRAEHVVTQDQDVGAALLGVALEAHDHHSLRILMKMRITYQNMSATDENSASAAATCWRVS